MQLSPISIVICRKRKEIGEVCKQANLITLKTQLARLLDYHAHLDTVKITCELEPQKSSLVHLCTNESKSNILLLARA